MLKTWFGRLWTLGFILCLAGCGGQSETTAESSEDTGAVQAQITQTSAPPAAQTPQPKKNLYPEVVVETNHGTFVLRLDSEKAPLTVDNFLTYVDGGHYNGTIIHQVRSGDILLGGGYTEDFTEKPTRSPVRNEADNGLKNVRGTIALARQPDTIDSSTCQFFLNLADNTHLDHHGRTPEEYGYCVFGKVIDGMEVLDLISQVPVEDKIIDGETFVMAPKEPIVIKSMHRR